MREQESYLEKPMFGCRACYLDGKLVLVLAFPGDEPWNGILLPVEREHHASLCSEYPALVEHPVLGKWLYLREDTDRFERDAHSIVSRIVGQDHRFGVIPQPKNRKKTRQGK